MNTERKLAEALRALRNHSTQSELYEAHKAADEALAEYDAADPTRALVMREALMNYASAEYVYSRDLRNNAKRHEWDAETRERFAQGADARRRVALELAAKVAP